MALSFLFTLFLCGLVVGANAKCAPRAGSSCESCPYGWTYNGGQCYLFQKTIKDWADAERSCNSLGGNLASIQSTAQYTFLRNLIHKEAGSHKTTWLGASDSAKDGVWLWTDGSRFVFNGWAKGEPNHIAGVRACMEMNFKGRDYVNDANCSLKRPFLCARDA